MLTIEHLAALLEHNRAAANAPVKEFSIGKKFFAFNAQPPIMGVINLSSDSWYRESVCLTEDRAVQRGKVLAAQGADIVDLGAESTLAHAVRVDDASQLPMDFTDANGTRVVGLSFAGGAAAVAGALNALLGPVLAVTNPSGSTLRILDDGAAGTTDVAALTARTTVTGTQNGLALSLFVDSGNADFTDAIAGTPQRRGFARS